MREIRDEGIKLKGGNREGRRETERNRAREHGKENQVN